MTECGYQWRVKLWRKHGGICTYCKCLTRLTPPGMTRLPPDAATVDHVYSRYHPRRKEKGGSRATVLSCSACNNKRGASEHAVVMREARRGK